MIKRSLDIFLALIGIMIFLPFLPVLALLIKLDSRGAVFYLCDRVGKDGKPFKMYKFRTMYDTPALVGPSVCPEGDPRVTPLGRFLRRSKMNELPQLINILKGDMTFVGPRPETPDLAALYPPYANAIFSVKPGLVGPNQILGRNEEECYPVGVEPEQYYIQEILPQKLPVDLAYVQTSSTFSDLKYIAYGVKETLFKALNWKQVLRNRSQIYLLCADTILSLASIVLAHTLRFAGFTHDQNVPFESLLPLVVSVRILCFISFGLYRTLIRYLSFHDIVGVLKGVTAGSILLVCLTTLLRFEGLSRLVFLLDWLCLVFLMSFLRFYLRSYWERHAGQHKHKRRNALIFGAGDAGVLAYCSLMAEKEVLYKVVGFLDDDPVKRHKTIYGRKVLGDRFTLGMVVQLYQVQEVFLAIPGAPLHEVAKIIEACQRAEVSYKVFPTLQAPPRSTALLHLEGHVAQLLETPDIEMDAPAVQRLVQGKNVLVIGASGALGIELCRQVLQLSPHKLVIMDRYESYLTDLLAHLMSTIHADRADRVYPVLCRSSSSEKIADVFLEHQPHIVIHAAARKYRPLFNIGAEHVVRDSYLYTFALAKQAASHGCHYFVMLSSMEAAKLGDPVADTLRAAEISLRHFFASHQTQLVNLRLYDVLDNRGSIVNILEEQIAHRETVTLPHPNAQCLVFSKRAAVHFILECLSLAAQGLSEQGIFVCNRFTSVSLLEVANKLACARGLALELDLPVKFLTGVDNDAVATQMTFDTQPCIATANPHITLLREQALPDSPQIAAVIQGLLKTEEGALENLAWEKYIHDLLHMDKVDRCQLQHG
jgi:FlaA1/EpsC-like NDP-sugar epimerase/lipopolysaccharide/colanic/teichoic acid biosynthesis glycosyltransferase